MGQEYTPPDVSHSTADQLQALIQYLPALSQAWQQQILPTEKATLAAQQEIAPQQAALNTQLYGQYGPELSRIGSQIASQEASATAKTLAGSGADLARAATSTQQIADPEYYKTRALTSDKIGELLGSINVNGLSGSERAETERYLNQQNQGRGSPDVSSNIKTVENASMFGSALQNKRNSLGQAITQATNFLPTAKSGIDVFQTITGRPSTTPNATAAAPVGSQANNLTSQLFGNIQNTQAQTQDLMASRRTTDDRVNNAIGSFCCFIFLEIHNGVLPWYVRICRDYYYEKEPFARIGYRRMASILVPLMHSNGIVRSLVNRFMVSPITEHGGFIFGVDGCKSRRGYKNFWFSIWKLIGKI